MQEDVPVTDIDRDTLLGCASVTSEEYFVVPPGNIDYVPDENYYKNLIKSDDNYVKDENAK